MTQRLPCGHLAPVIAAAVHLLETGDAESVHILTGTRPTYTAVKFARSLALESGFEVTVDGNGDLRFHKSSNGSAGERVPRSSLLPTVHARHWFDRLMEMWHAALFAGRAQDEGGREGVPGHQGEECSQ
jgi:hypothetical protein